MTSESNTGRTTEEERLEAVSVLRGSLDGSPGQGDELEVPEWHNEILAERLRKLESGEEQLLTIEEAKAQLAVFNSGYLRRAGRA